MAGKEVDTFAGIAPDTRGDWLGGGDMRGPLSLQTGLATGGVKHCSEEKLGFLLMTPGAGDLARGDGIIPSDWLFISWEKGLLTMWSLATLAPLDMGVSVAAGL